MNTRVDSRTPPEENISNIWQRLHAGQPLLHPLHPSLRNEIIKYGEFAQATYDAFSKLHGNCRYKDHKDFNEAHLTNYGYQVIKYIYALSPVRGLHHLKELVPHRWTEDSNWMGFVAVTTNEQSQKVGRRDIVMAWRGTVVKTEWISDLKFKPVPLGDETDARVHYGFHKIYTSKSESSRYNKQKSASEQVMEEVQKLVRKYREEVSFTITGHSLGGALALLNAYEAASSLPGIPITVISFGAPQVGNIAFTEKINELKVKVLRIVVNQDIVPKLPLPLSGELRIILTNINDDHGILSITRTKNWMYTHVGKKLGIDKPDEHKLDIIRYHKLKVYLQYLKKNSPVEVKEALH